MGREGQNYELIQDKHLSRRDSIPKRRRSRSHNYACVSEASESSSSIDEDSVTSSVSSFSSEEKDESSSISSSSTNWNGPLYELSELMDHLPLKRGLSKYYDGTSESFVSLATVKSSEDVRKGYSRCRKKMKTCKSYGGLDIA